MFSPEKFDSETIQKSTEKTYIEKNKKIQKKPANPVLFNSDQKSIILKQTYLRLPFQINLGGSFTSFVLKNYFLGSIKMNFLMIL